MESDTVREIVATRVAHILRSLARDHGLAINTRSYLEKGSTVDRATRERICELLSQSKEDATANFVNSSDVRLTWRCSYKPGLPPGLVLDNTTGKLVKDTNSDLVTPGTGKVDIYKYRYPNGWPLTEYDLDLSMSGDKYILMAVDETNRVRNVLRNDGLSNKVLTGGQRIVAHCREWVIGSGNSFGLSLFDDNSYDPYVNWIKGAMEEIAKESGEYIKDVIGEVDKQVEYVTTNIAEILAKLFKLLAEEARDIADLMVDGIKNIVKMLLATIHDIFESSKQLIGKTVDKLIETFNGAVSKLQIEIDRAVSAAKAAADAATAAAKAAADAAIAAAKQVAQEAVDAAKREVDKLREDVEGASIGIAVAVVATLILF